MMQMVRRWLMKSGGSCWSRCKPTQGRSSAVWLATRPARRWPAKIKRISEISWIRSRTCIVERVSSQETSFALPCQSTGRRLSLLKASAKSWEIISCCWNGLRFTFSSACKSSMDLMSSLSLSMAVMKSATISAINFEVLPLSSLIVIGLSSYRADLTWLLWFFVRSP